MTPDVAVTEFLYAHEYAAKSLLWYQQMHGVFTRFCDTEHLTNIGEVSAPLVRRFFDTVRARTDPRTGQPISSQSVHGYARAVRALLNWCAREGLLDERATRRIGMPKREQKVIAILSVDQIERLLCTARSARDKAIIAVLLDTGLQANELCTLTLDHVRFTPERAWLLVHEKRDKWREVGLGKRARQALHKYIYRERPTQAWRAQGREREHVYWVAIVAQEKDIVHLPPSEPFAGFPIGYYGHELWAELNERDAQLEAQRYQASLHSG